MPNKDGSKMVCIMPSIEDYLSLLDQTQTVPVSIFFNMDGITSLGEKEFPSKIKLSRHLYYENPKLYKFEGDETLLLFDIAEEFLKIKVLCFFGYKTEFFFLLAQRSGSVL